MPRSTAYFEAQQVATSVPATVAYENGELVVAATERVRDDEIVWIAKQASLESSRTDSAPSAGSAAGAASHYLISWSRESTNDDAEKQAKAEHPFQLFTRRLDGESVEKLPPDVLGRHLLKAVPPVLRAGSGTPEAAGSAGPSKLHVVVSTRSGVGKAQEFFDAILEPLLTVFGLEPSPSSPALANGTPATNGATPATAKKAGQYHLVVTSNSHSIHDFASTLSAPTTNGSAVPTAQTPAAATRHTVILLSGDGGVVDLLNGVSPRANPADLPTIVVLPLGTGNALFHSLHKPQYVAPATASASPLVLGLRTLFRGRPVALPNFEATFSPGSHTVTYTAEEEEEAAQAGSDENSQLLQENRQAVERLRGAIVASYGFHAQLVWESDTPEYRQHGAKRFSMAAHELIKTSHAYTADVRMALPGTAKPGTVVYHGDQFNYVLASMVSNLEKTFTISPASRLLDGQLRLVHFGAVGGTKTIEIMTAAYNEGKHVGMKWPRVDAKGEAVPGGGEDGVGYEAIQELEVNVLEKDARWRKACIDGTIVDIPEGGWMRVHQGAPPVLQIIVDDL